MKSNNNSVVVLVMSSNNYTGRKYEVNSGSSHYSSADGSFSSTRTQLSQQQQIVNSGNRQQQLCSLNFGQTGGHDFSRATDPEEAEARMVIRGVEAAQDAGIQRVLIVYDCKRLVKAFASKSTNLSWGALTLAQDL
ncbi:hypothetical protein GIB67_032979 [Kingdonia uniflora]|uniref:RNase H type-1 domain-containing protein n=1 Tax=Kingdonia uniflora TaxID=39325 RepID=A0A7J7MY95_9MAGN|nr:hypothetical protein GIB67_032979 [Kingdonia uniflora]